MKKLVVLLFLLLAFGFLFADEETTVEVPTGLVPPMVLVEKGTFTMGEMFLATLTYDFYVGKYEVTFAEYDKFILDIGGITPSDNGWGRGQRPVINVSWWDAIAFCNWLSQDEGLPKAYDSDGNLLDANGNITTDPSKTVGYRLLTETEWEFAARGGKKTEGYRYSGSNTVGRVAWYLLNSWRKSQEVGEKAPNELGIYDMSGNVWEWCSDFFAGFTRDVKTDPYVDKGSNRVIRGGSWNDGASGVRLLSRDSSPSAVSNAEIGFRIARTAH